MKLRRGGREELGRRRDGGRGLARERSKVDFERPRRGEQKLWGWSEEVAYAYRGVIGVYDITLRQVRLGSWLLATSLKDSGSRKDEDTGKSRVRMIPHNAAYSESMHLYTNFVFVPIKPMRVVPTPLSSRHIVPHSHDIISPLLHLICETMLSLSWDQATSSARAGLLVF